ncbi:SDR family oxidoreductase [Pseudomonadales bacterium]|nr:SDR family oxidoreductase [Pseudomonadales bacterium]
MMTDRLAGKVALITGGTSGIGAATARLFAAEGACVVIVGRSEEKGQKLADSLGSQVIYSKADITQEADIAAAIALTVKHFGKLDILFNNAGGPVGAGLQGVTPEHIQTGVSLLWPNDCHWRRLDYQQLKHRWPATPSRRHSLFRN